MKMMKRSLIAAVLAVVILCQAALATGDVGSITLSQVQQRGTELTMYASLLDESGNQVHSLKPDQFSVWVDSAFDLPAEDVKQFDTNTTGIHYVIAVDVSGSIQAKQMNDIKAGLTAFAQKLNERDRMTLITFGNVFTTLLNQGSVSEFISQVDSLKRGEKMTALYGGVQEAIDRAKSNSMRSVVIVITDGKDEPTKEMSGYTKESIWNKVIDAQVPLYCIGVNNSKLDKESLAEFADKTGGAQYIIDASNVSSVLSNIRNIIVGSVVIRTTLQNKQTPPRQGREETEFQLYYLPSDTSAGEVYSNKLSQMINWSNIPAPTPSPTPRVTPEIELQLAISELKYSSELTQISGVVKVNKGEVKPEDIIITVDDAEWTTYASINGVNITFDAEGMLPSNRNNIYVNAIISAEGVKSGAAVLKVLPSDTPTPSPSPTPVPKLDLQIDEISDIFEAGKNVRVTGVVNVEGTIDVDDLKLYVNDVEADASFEYLNAYAYGFTVNTVLDVPEMLFQVRLQNMDLNSRRYKITLTTPSPTPAPQISVALDRSNIIYEVGKEFIISGTINITGSVEADDLALVVSNIPTSFDKLEYKQATNSYAFEARSTLADNSRENLNIQVMIKDETDIKDEATIVMVTPSPSPTPTPSPKPPIITPPPVEDDSTEEAVIITPPPSPTPEPGFPQNVIIMVQRFVKERIDAGQLWILIVAGALLLAMLVLLIVLLVRRSKRKKDQSSNIQGTSFDDHNRDDMENAAPTTMEGDPDVGGDPTLTEDDSTGSAAGSNPSLTESVATVDIDGAGEYVFDTSGGTVLNDEEYDYTGGTVLNDDDGPSIDIHMIERSRNGQQQERDLLLTMNEDLEFGRTGCGANVEINEETVSAHHMQLSYDGEKVYITDLNSRNGTKINKTRIPANSPTELHSGESVAIGKTTLAFTFDLDAAKE